MSYEKPIELRISTQNISGTEARSVEALAKIERLLNKALAAGELFKSPSASIDYKTHEVTKSFFVRKDAEKIVRDTLKAHEELFINPLTIASKEAKTRKYKVDVEGDRALATIHASAASHGGRAYGNQNGTFIEVPAYSGVRSSVASKAESLTKELRNKINVETERFLYKEQRETKLLEEAKLAAIEKEKEEQKKKQGKTADKWNKLTKAQEKSVQDEIDAYFAAEEKSKVVEATKAEADARSEKVKRAKAESAMNNKWQKLLYKRDADVAAEEAKRAAEEEKVKKEVAKFFRKEDSSAEAEAARQEAKNAAKESREKEAKARELKRKEASMFRLITKREETEAKEERKAQKEKEREEVKKQKEAEKEERQKEREKEKEERLAATESKYRGLAIVAGISGAILLLRKLISLVENIITGVLKASSVAFTTTMDADRLGIDPVILRNMQYAGLAKGIGEAPINALKTTQSLFGTQLLAAENVDKITQLAPMLGDDIVGLINKGEGGKSPFKMTSLIIDSAFNNYKNGLNELNRPTGDNKANARSIATTLAQVSEDYATNFIRMVQDYEAGKDVEGFQQWIYDAMPISSPTSATLEAASENKKEYDEAVAELKSVINLIATLLSPLLNPLTEAIQKLSGYLMLLTGDKAGVAEFSRKNYSKMRDAKARDEAEITKLTAIENEYLAKNKDIFPDKQSFTDAVTDLQKGKVPSAISNNPERLQEFFKAFGVRKLMDSYGMNISSYEKDIADYNKLDPETNTNDYILGKKLFSFSDRSAAEVQSYTELLIRNAITKAYEVSKGVVQTPQSQQDLYIELVQNHDSVTEYNAIEEELKNLYAKRSLYDKSNFSLKAIGTRLVTPEATEIAEVKRLNDEIEALEARKKAIDDEAKAKIMTPVTSGTGFTMDDSIAAAKAVSEVLNTLAGNLVVEKLRSNDLIPEGANRVDIAKREDGNLNVTFIGMPEGPKTITVPLSDGYVETDISLFLAQ